MNKTIKEKLENLLADSDNDLEKDVINDLLEEEESDPSYGAKGYLKDLLQHGCVSGMVSKLIYYHDTKEYFNKFDREIEELKEELEDNLGEPLKIGSPVSNWLAWFGYEEMARKIADKLEIEI